MPDTASTKADASTTVNSTYRAAASNHIAANRIGQIQDLSGGWEDTRFSLFARPNFSEGSPDAFFLQLNLPWETMEFTPINSPVYYCGSVQAGIAIFGINPPPPSRKCRVWRRHTQSSPAWGRTSRTATRSVPSAFRRVSFSVANPRFFRQILPLPHRWPSAFTLREEPVCHLRPVRTEPVPL